MMIYGLATCPICQRAQKTLTEAGREFTFRDVRADPLDAGELDVLITEFGDRLVDHKSSDYRGLSDWLKASEPEAQIAAQPKVMARPVIFDGEVYHLGWGQSVQNALLPK